ncbi:MAG: hypothetical protein QW478_00940 [Candidatus Micrarchaeaceae archaeon]
MQIIGPDCLKQIFYLSEHRDLINWRLTCKVFKNIIDNLYFPYDFYTSLEKGYYLVIKKLINLNHDWHKALLCACKHDNLKIIKLIMNKRIYDFNNIIYTAFKYNNLRIANYIINSYSLVLPFLSDLACILNEEMTSKNPDIIKLKTIFDYRFDQLRDYISTNIIYNRVENMDVIKQILNYNRYYNYDLLCKLISIHSKCHNKYELISYLLSIDTNPNCLFLFRQEPYYDVSDILELLFIYGANPNDQKLMALFIRMYMLDYNTINNIEVLIKYGFNEELMINIINELYYECFDESVTKYNTLVDMVSKYFPNKVKKISKINIIIKIKKEFLSYVDKEIYEFDSYKKMENFVKEKFKDIFKAEYMYIDEHIKISPNVIIGDIVYIKN